jgi:hypothetical protein
MPVLRLGELRNSRTVFSSSRPLVIVPLRFFRLCRLRKGAGRVRRDKGGAMNGIALE